MEGFVVDQVSKTYMDENQRPFQVLHNVAFSWSSGENIAVLGESGSGKSTLARLLIGIEKPNSGTITWNGEDITRWKSSTWREKRKHIQAVFQDASGTLNPARSVYHNVEEALRNLTHLDRPANKSQVEISGFGSSEKGNTKSSRRATQNRNGGQPDGITQGNQSCSRESK